MAFSSPCWTSARKASARVQRIQNDRNRVQIRDGFPDNTPKIS
jgi:hypothetical protein